MQSASFRPAIYSTTRAIAETAGVFKTGALNHSAIPPRTKSSTYGVSVVTDRRRIRRYTRPCVLRDVFEQLRGLSVPLAAQSAGEEAALQVRFQRNGGGVLDHAQEPHFVGATGLQVLEPRQGPFGAPDLDVPERDALDEIHVTAGCPCSLASNLLRSRPRARPLVLLVKGCRSRLGVEWRSIRPIIAVYPHGAVRAKVALRLNASVARTHAPTLQVVNANAKRARSRAPEHGSPQALSGKEPHGKESTQ